MALESTQPGPTVFVVTSLAPMPFGISMTTPDPKTTLSPTPSGADLSIDAYSCRDSYSSPDANSHTNYDSCTESDRRRRPSQLRASTDCMTDWNQFRNPLSRAIWLLQVLHCVCLSHMVTSGKAYFHEGRDEVLGRHCRSYYEYLHIERVTAAI